MKPQPRAAVKRKYRLRADPDARRKRKDKRFLSNAGAFIYHAISSTDPISLREMGNL